MSTGSGKGGGAGKVRRNRNPFRAPRAGRCGVVGNEKGPSILAGASAAIAH